MRLSHMYLFFSINVRHTPPGVSMLTHWDIYDDGEGEEVKRLLLQTGEVVQIGGSSAEVSNQGGSSASQPSMPDDSDMEDPYSVTEDYSLDHC